MRKSFCCVIAAVAVIALCVRSIQAQQLRKPPAYKFRESEAFRALDQPTKKRLEQVVTDFAVLEKALNSFMDAHGGSPPKLLQDLVPKYLKKLPVDPFATKGAELSKGLKHFERSLDGRGYLYNHRPSGHVIKSYEPLELQPSPGAWDIRSVGLKDFPLRYRVSSPGLIRTRGYWGRLKLDVF